MRVRLLDGVVALCVLLLAACEDSGPPMIDAQGSEQVTVSGEVIEKNDQVPVDGGVTMTLQLDDGSHETLLFSSLFTAPPPSPEQLELYQVIAQVELGDRVRAEGKRREDGIALEALTIVKR